MFRLTILFSAILLTSCNDMENDTFSVAEQNLIDSLYQKKIDIIRTEEDSLCNATHDARLRILTDSIKNEYIKEIEAIIK